MFRKLCLILLAILLSFTACNAPSEPVESTTESPPSVEPTESTTDAATTAEPETEPVPRTLEGVPGNWYFSWDPPRQEVEHYLNRYQEELARLTEEQASIGFRTPGSYSVKHHGVTVSFEFFQDVYTYGEIFQVRITVQNGSDAPFTFHNEPYDGTFLGGRNRTPYLTSVTVPGYFWIPLEDMLSMDREGLSNYMEPITLLPGESCTIERAMDLLFLQESSEILYLEHSVEAKGEEFNAIDWIQVPFNSAIEPTYKKAE